MKFVKIVIYYGQHNKRITAEKIIFLEFVTHTDFNYALTISHAALSHNSQAGIVIAFKMF